MMQSGHNNAFNGTGLQQPV